MSTACRYLVPCGMLLGALIACSHQPKRVDCDNHLVPINAATSAAVKNPGVKAGDP